MPKKSWILLSLASFSLDALAQELTAPAPLPTFAVNSQTQSGDKSLWKGLYFGTEAMVISSQGVKAQLGGDGFIGYDTHFDNNLQLNLRASTGYLPSLVPQLGISGVNYAESNMRLAYTMGRLTPFVSAGILLARPNAFAPTFSNTVNAMNDLLSPAPGTKTLGRVDAGFNYAINNNLSVGMAVSVGPSPSFFGPLD